MAQECGSQALHKHYDGVLALDEALWRQAAELGWLGIGLPEEHGGLGMGIQGLDVLYSALGTVAAPGSFMPTLTGALLVSEFVEPQLCARLLPAVVAGELQIATPAGEDQGEIKLRDGRLHGVSAVMLGSRTADLAIVAVSSDAGANIALVSLNDTGSEFNLIDVWDQTRSLGKVSCSSAQPLAILSDHDGIILQRYRHLLALAVASDSVAGGRRIALQTVDYLKERHQFGRPLASFQALKHRCADLFMTLTTAEQALRHGVDMAARRKEGAWVWAVLAKATASEAFKFVAAESVQLHGGVGHTWEFDCHIFLKRALLNESLAGENNALRDLAAAEFDAVIRRAHSIMEIPA